MEAQTLNCPMCGAPTSTGSSNCSHCNARLAMVACPSCFGMIFQGAKYCSHCGARADRTELPAGAVRRCPKCKVGLNSVMIGKTELCECPRCEGLWADVASLESICADREQQSMVLGVAAPIPTPTNLPLEQVRYVQCPMCSQLMHRINFARCSNVVVDVCKPHGTWFDKDELRRIVEFIRAGGFEKKRALEIAELEREKERLKAAQAAAAQDRASDYRSDYSTRHSLWEPALSVAALSILDSIFD